MIDIGDTRKITQAKLVLRRSGIGIVDEWEFKGLYIYRTDYGSRFVLCEGTAWNLVGNSTVARSKLQAYLWTNWTNMGDSDIWD